MGLAKEQQMKTDKFTITRRLDKQERHWISDPIEAGTTMYDYTGCTYGCVSHEGRALTHDPNGGTPFLEIPNDAFIHLPNG